MNPRVVERLMVGVFALVTVLVVAGVVMQRIDFTAVALALVTLLGGLTTYYLNLRKDEDDRP